MDIILIIILLVMICCCCGMLGRTEGFGEKISGKDKHNLLLATEFIHKLFQKTNIWYSISFGTLLGAVRHRGLIPWDDDIDLLISRVDLEKFEKIIPLIEQQGYRVEKEWKLYRVYATDKLFIDLFIIDSTLDNKIIRCQTEKGICEHPPKNYEWWWKWFNFPIELLNKRKLFDFEDIQLYGPIEADKLLSFWYGDDYLTVCKTPYLENHETYIEQHVTDCPKLPIPQF